MVITLIASNTIISLLLEALSRPSIALRESLINTINSGMMAGKLKMAIKVLLLPALELIPPPGQPLKNPTMQTTND